MTTTTKRKSYHHGDLRSALIESGLALLAQRGAEEPPGLREVARETGVSATAVYRHFADKDALYSALAAEGFERLTDAQEAAAAQTRGAENAFKAIGRAYVRFAIDNPPLFRLMSSHMHLIEESADPKGGNRAARLLRDHVAGLMPEDASADQHRTAALQAWALVHGLAVLILGGQVPDEPKIIEAVVGDFGWQ